MREAIESEEERPTRVKRNRYADTDLAGFSLSKAAQKGDTRRKTEEIAYRSRKNKFYIDEKYKKSEQTSNQSVVVREVFQTVLG